MAADLGSSGHCQGPQTFSALLPATATDPAGNPAKAAGGRWRLLISYQCVSAAPSGALESQSSVLNNAVWEKAGMHNDGTLKFNCCQTRLQRGGGAGGAGRGETGGDGCH